MLGLFLWFLRHLIWRNEWLFILTLKRVFWHNGILLSWKIFLFLKFFNGFCSFLLKNFFFFSKKKIVNRFENETFVLNFFKTIKFQDFRTLFIIVMLKIIQIQCDQITRLFANFGPFSAMKIWPMANKICPIHLKILPNTSWTL